MTNPGDTRCDAAVVTSIGGMWTVLATAQDYGEHAVLRPVGPVDVLVRAYLEVRFHLWVGQCSLRALPVWLCNAWA